MSATATATSDTLDASTTRLLGLSANLLPPEIKDNRRIVLVRWVTLVALATVVVLLGAWYAVTWYQTSQERDKATEAETIALSLRQQQRNYHELIAAQSQTALLNSQLKSLLATDVQWATLFTALRAAQPKGVALTNLAVALADPTASGAGAVSTSANLSTASGLPSADGSTPIGALTIGGTGTTKGVIAAYVDAMGTVPGVGNTLLSGVTNNDTTGVDFTVRADLSKAALSGYYTKSRD